MELEYRSRGDGAKIEDNQVEREPKINNFGSAIMFKLMAY